MNFNYRYCLPNKFFESIQARLMLLCGPSAEMEYLIDKYELGTIGTGFEADDILATLAKSCDFPVSIVSGDRDSFQLIDDRVTILYPRKGMSDLVLMTPDAVFEKYGVTPKQYRTLAALVGESSDNLPGVPGVDPRLLPSGSLSMAS